MSNSLSANLTLRMKASFADDIGTTDIPALSADVRTSNGTGANNADSYYQQRRTVALAATPDALDLAGGSLYGYGPNGPSTPLTFAELTTLVVVNRSVTATITVGGGANGVVAWQVPLPPGFRLAIGGGGDPGIPVTAGTGDVLQVSSSEDAADYDVAIAGRSA